MQLSILALFVFGSIICLYLPFIPYFGLGGFAYGAYGLYLIIFLEIATTVIFQGNFRKLSALTLLLSIAILFWLMYGGEHAFDGYTF